MRFLKIKTVSKNTITHRVQKPPEVGIEPGTFWIHKDMRTKSFNASKYLGLSKIFEIDSNA